MNAQQIPATPSICTARRKDGSPCTLAAVPGDRFCFAHVPAALEARRRGGACRATAARLLKHGTPESRELAQFVHEALVAVRAGELEARVRLERLLAKAYGEDWSLYVQDRLLAAAGK